VISPNSVPAEALGSINHIRWEGGREEDGKVETALLSVHQSERSGIVGGDGRKVDGESLKDIFQLDSSCTYS
jgi:hypothetical protein